MVRESNAKPKHLVVLSDDGFQRLNAHSFMKGLLKEGKNLHCVDIDYGPLLRVKTCVPYAADGSKEIRFVTVGLSLQYSDISFVLSSDGHELRPSGSPMRDVASRNLVRGFRADQTSGVVSH